MLRNNPPQKIPAACSRELVILCIDWAAAQLGQAFLGSLADLDWTCLHFQLISARLGWALRVSLIPWWDQWASPRTFFSGRWQIPKRTNPTIQSVFQTFGHVRPANKTSHVTKSGPRGGGELWLFCGNNFKVTQQRAGTKGGLKNWPVATACCRFDLVRSKPY